MTITFHDLEIMARTVWGEARGEPFNGQQAVAGVIVNRMKHPHRWPRTIAEVCQQPWQFSCWNENDPNREKLLAVDLTNDALHDAIRASLLAIAGHDESYEANHYFAETIAQPDWADHMTQTTKIGTHLFFKA